MSRLRKMGGARDRRSVSLIAGATRLADTGVRNLVKAGVVLSALSVASMVAIGLVDSLGRAIFNKPFAGAVEISEALLAITIFMALGAVQQRKGHIVVDVFVEMFGPRLSVVSAWTAQILMLAVLVFVAWRSGVSATSSTMSGEIAAGLVPVPIWLAKIIATAGLVIAALEVVRQTLTGSVRRTGTRDEKLESTQ